MERNVCSLSGMYLRMRTSGKCSSYRWNLLIKIAAQRPPEVVPGILKWWPLATPSGKKTMAKKQSRSCQMWGPKSCESITTKHRVLGISYPKMRRMGLEYLSIHWSHQIEAIHVKYSKNLPVPFGAFGYYNHRLPVNGFFLEFRGLQIWNHLTVALKSPVFTRFSGKKPKPLLDTTWWLHHP